MRILTGIDVPFAPVSGSVILCDDLYGEIERRGHAVCFVALAGSGEAWSQMTDVRLLRLPNKCLHGPGFRDYVAGLAQALEGVIETFQPDILHVQHLSFGMAAALGRISSELPQLAFCHGPDVLYGMRDPFHRAQVMETFTRSQGTVFPTRPIREAFRSLEGLGLCAKMHHVPWGLPEPLLAQAAPREFPRTGPPRLLFAGRLEENKGVDVLLEAVARMSVQVELTILGSGDRCGVQELVARLGLAARVRIEDWVPRRELWRRFRQFDCLVVPTRCVEAFSLLTLEAQAHGLPVAVSDVSGVGEVVGRSGLRFPPDNPRTLAARLDGLLSRPGGLEALSRRSTENARRYPISRTANRILEISGALLAG